MVAAGEPEILHARRSGTAGGRATPRMLLRGKFMPYDRSGKRYGHLSLYHVGAIALERSMLCLRRPPFNLVLVGAPLTFPGAGAAAQPYPAKPLHLVVPFAPGGITDILARALATRLGENWGQQVIVENKPGANSQVGAEYAAKAAPDGYTLMVS